MRNNREIAPLLSRSQVALAARLPQREDETPQDYLLFQKWVQMGTCALDRFARSVGTSLARATELHDSYDWQGRYDVSEYAAEKLLYLSTLHDILGTPQGVTSALHKIVAQHLSAYLTAWDPIAPPKIGDFRDLVAAVKAFVELQRLVQGESTATVDLKFSEEILESLTSDEIYALRQAIVVT